LKAQKKIVFFSSAVCLGMGPTTTNFMPHNNSSKQQQQKDEKMCNLCIQIIASWNRSTSSALTPEGFQGPNSGRGWGRLCWYMFPLEQKYLDFNCLSKASYQTHIADLI
jgi:hypothetical protein